jgi:hypothetical protein
MADYIVIMERDNAAKDYQLIERLKSDLQKTCYRTIFYRQTETAFLLDPKGVLAKLPRWVRIPVKAGFLLLHPGRWDYFFSWRPNGPSVDSRCKKLKKFIKSLGDSANIIIFSRSASGIIASLVADDLGIKKLICLGYPFKHPQKPVEEKRFSHLAYIKTPFLILQGARDEYGGIDIQNTYQLSGNVSLVFVDTDHDFIVSYVEWENIIGKISHFILNN